MLSISIGIVLVLVTLHLVPSFPSLILQQSLKLPQMKQAILEKQFPVFFHKIFGRTKVLAIDLLHYTLAEVIINFADEESVGIEEII